MHCGVPEQEPANRTVLGYSRLADLEFALIVWRQNLKRDLASTSLKEVRLQTFLAMRRSGFKCRL